MPDSSSNITTPSFEIYDYSEENLIKSFEYPDHITENEIVSLNKRHLDFFKDYFREDSKLGSLGAKTIIREKNYLSNSHLSDYSNFYNTTFTTYKRFCIRVHFFSENINNELFEELIYTPSETHKDIWEKYLGYIVIRPLPKAIFGATILKTYSQNLRFDRHYPATRNYTINVFGKTIELDSLIYQEQDSVVGMCASNALWACLHKVCMPDMFHKQLPISVSETTKSVKNPFAGSKGRRFPNSGLTILQICEVIESVGLVTEVRTKHEENNEENKYCIDKLTNLKAFTYAYLKMGIPIMLGIEIGKDWHLVTVVGYNFNLEYDYSHQESHYFSEKIDKFYVHDDQVGPFSRMSFCEGENEIITAWKDENKPDELLRAKIISVFVPLQEQIRITYEDIADKVLIIKDLVQPFISGYKATWEIHLDFLNKYREQVFQDSSIARSIKEKVIGVSHPKFIWIVRGYIDNGCFIEFVFDATNIPDASFCRIINVYNDELRKEIKSKLENEDAFHFGEKVIQKLSKKYLELLKVEVERGF